MVTPCTLTLPAVADGLLSLVDAGPSAVAKMLGALPSEGSRALVDRLAGVMAVNSLSAEAVLARFFGQDLLSLHLVQGMGGVSCSCECKCIHART